MVSGWRVSFAATPSGSSKSIIATGESDFGTTWKSDTIDAETAARSVLAGIATAVPKSADGAAEMVRQIKVARDTAVKAQQFCGHHAHEALIVNAPAELRELHSRLTPKACAAAVLTYSRL